MAIIAMANESATFTPAPAGTHQAVCVDVIDKGLQPNRFRPGKMQPKISIVWQIGEARDDGKRYVLYKQYTLSLNEKATLRHDLQSWRGKPFTRDEEMGFDVETVKGANCLLNVQHVERDGKVYANVMGVMALPKGFPKLAALDYVRHVTDPDTNGDHGVESEQPMTPITDDDIPF